MIKDIEDFYNKTKLKKAARLTKGKMPIEFIHVFHKEYPRLPAIKLRRWPFAGEFETLLKRRRSYRHFSIRPIPVGLVAKILKSCTITDSDPERRSYPSAGARYPVEIYLIAFNIKGLKRGAYHFNISSFSLELLLDSDLRKREREFISPFLRQPAGVIVFTSVFSRSYIKYSYKAYPFSLIEAGHIAQNLLLSCTKYDVGVCPVGGFVNDTVSEILDLTNEELPIYVLGFGLKK